MAEEAQLMDAPPAEEQSGLGEGFGNISEAFDKAFPATAGNEPEPGNEPPAPQSRREEPTLKPAEKPAPPPAENEAPESLFTPPTEKPAAVSEPEIEVPKSLTKPKDIAAWKDIRAREQQAAAKTATLEAELTKLRSQKPEIADEGVKARMEQLEATNRELSDRIASVDLQSHPVFQAKFVKPREHLLNTAANQLKTIEKDPSGLAKAMALNGRARIEALDNFFDDIESPTVRNKVAAIVDQIDNLDEQRAAVLADTRGSLDQLQRNSLAEQQRMAQESEKQLAGVFEGAYEHLRDKVGFEVLKEVEGAEWWNKQAQQAKEAARNLMFKIDNPQDMAIAAHLAATSGIHRSLWLRERTQRLAAQKELAEIKGAEPTLRGSADRENGTETDDKLTFAQRVARDSHLP